MGNADEPAFDGKVALITGGAAGFGKAFATAFAERGAAVVLADIDALALDGATTELERENRRVLGVECDVANDEEVQVAVESAVTTFGGVDILINNAGKHLTRYNRPFGEQPRADVRELFDVNIMGVVNCTLACRDTMRGRGGGVIVNIASIAGYSVTSPYGVSKLAVRGLTMAFATELAANRIRVNAIAPGLMATENAVADLPQQLVDRFVNDLQLVHRLGEVDDVVSAALYLCSDRASFITGETLKVSGGTALAI